MIAHAHDPVWILKQALARTDIPKRILHRKAEVFQRLNLRIDDEEFRVAQLRATLKEVEWITGQAKRRTNLVYPTLASQQRHPPPHPLKPAQGIRIGEKPQFRPRRFIQPVFIHRAKGCGPLIFHTQPTQRQQLAVFHHNLSLDLFAGEHPLVLEPALVRDPAHRRPAPRPRNAHDHQHKTGQGHQREVTRQPAHHKEQQRHTHPAVIQQAAHGVSPRGAPFTIQDVAFGLLKIEHQASTGTGTVFTISATISAGLRPRRRICGLSMMRWVITLGARCFTSSGSTKSRP